MKKTIQTEFSNCQEFIEFVKPKLENVNFENTSIYNKMKTIFSQHQNAKATITNLTKIVKKELGFKAKSTLQLEFYLERGWSEEYGKKLISDRQSKNSKKAIENGSLKGRFSKDWFKERYSNDWEKRYKEKHSKTSRSLENYKRKYGEEEGKKRFTESNKKRSYTVSLEGRIETYGIEKGTEIFNDYCKLRKKLMSEESFIERYGEKEGKSKWKKRNSTIGYKNSLNFYIEEYGEEKGRKLISEIRKRSISEFKILYGEDAGEKKWNDYILKLESRSNSSFSKISQELFESIGYENAEFGKNERIIVLDERMSKSTNKNYLKPDFILGNKIIEFYGDLWHANPLIFEATDIHIPFYNKEKTAAQQWTDDKKRVDCLKKLGYEVLIIWESDYIKNKNDIIQQCIDFIEN